MIKVYSHSKLHINQTHAIKLPDQSYSVLVNNFHNATTSEKAETAVRDALAATFDDSVVISANEVAPRSASLRFNTSNEEDVRKIVATLNKVILFSLLFFNWLQYSCFLLLACLHSYLNAFLPACLYSNLSVFLSYLLFAFISFLYCYPSSPSFNDVNDS